MIYIPSLFRIYVTAILLFIIFLTTYWWAAVILTIVFIYQEVKYQILMSSLEFLDDIEK